MIHADAKGLLDVVELVPGLVEVRVEGRLTPEVGAMFPRFAREVARRRDRCSVFLDVRALESFDGDVRDAWIGAVLEHRHALDEVVVLTRGVLVTLSARAASLALTGVGVRFDVVTDEQKYLTRRRLAASRNRHVEGLAAALVQGL